MIVFCVSILCYIIYCGSCLQCFDAVGLVSGRASGLSKTEWWGAGVVVCLERGADYHEAQLMPLPLTVCCFSEIQIVFTFLVPDKGLCVCVSAFEFCVYDIARCGSYWIVHHVYCLSYSLPYLDVCSQSNVLIRVGILL